MNGLNKTESGIFISVISFFPKDLLFKTYLPSLQLVLNACVVVIKSLPVLLHTADHIFVLCDQFLVVSNILYIIMLKDMLPKNRLLNEK